MFKVLPRSKGAWAAPGKLAAMLMLPISIVFVFLENDERSPGALIRIGVPA